MHESQPPSKFGVRFTMPQKSKKRKLILATDENWKLQWTFQSKQIRTTLPFASRAARTRHAWHTNKSLADFAKREDAQVERLFVGVFQPPDDVGFGPDANQFRDAIWENGVSGKTGSGENGVRGKRGQRPHYPWCRENGVRDLITHGARRGPQRSCRGSGRIHHLQSQNGENGVKDLITHWCEARTATLQMSVLLAYTDGTDAHPNVITLPPVNGMQQSTSIYGSCAEEDCLQQSSMSERVFARLKDELGGRSIRVRGAAQIRAHLMFGVLALTIDQLLRLADSRRPSSPKQSPASKAELRRAHFCAYSQRLFPSRQPHQLTAAAGSSTCLVPIFDSFCKWVTNHENIPIHLSQWDLPRSKPIPPIRFRHSLC